MALRAQGRSLRLTLQRGPGDLLIAAAEDLGESERLRREAARAREHLAKVLRSVDDAIMTLDADGRVISGNDAVVRTAGGWTVRLVRESGEWRVEDVVGTTP